MVLLLLVAILPSSQPATRPATTQAASVLPAPATWGGASTPLVTTSPTTRPALAFIKTTQPTTTPAFPSVPPKVSVDAQIAAIQADAASARAEAAAARALAAEADARVRSQHFPWWQVIPWIIAGTAATIACRNYRLSRHPNVRIFDVHKAIAINLQREIKQSLSFRLHCLGSDLYDVRIKLEGRRRGKQPDPQWISATPVSEISQPIRNGQIVKYEINYAHLEQVHLNSFPDLAKVPIRDVCLAVYISDDILIYRLPAKKFEHHLRIFAIKPDIEFIDHPDGTETCIDHVLGTSITSGVTHTS